MAQGSEGNNDFTPVIIFSCMHMPRAAWQLIFILHILDMAAPLNFIEEMAKSWS